MGFIYILSYFRTFYFKMALKIVFTFITSISFLPCIIQLVVNESNILRISSISTLALFLSVEVCFPLNTSFVPNITLL